MIDPLIPVLSTQFLISNNRFNMSGNNVHVWHDFRRVQYTPSPSLEIV